MFFRKKKSNTANNSLQARVNQNEELRLLERNMIDAYSASRKGKDLELRLQYLKQAEQEFYVLQNYCQVNNIPEHMESWMHIPKKDGGEWSYIERIYDDISKLQKRIKKGNEII